MILKGSQRGGARQLAVHLLNDRDNDHVTVQELRGFMADDLYGALAETQAIAKGTRCTQPIFSLSLNPPKDGSIHIEGLLEAADRAEEVLGLKGQPRAVVIHEKNGRRHAHVVWSRIDAEEMKAINLPYFKNRLREVSKELYLEHGWELPDGHKTNGWKNPLNFTLAEWQQAKRVELDPREIKLIFRDAWVHSDNLHSFKNALEERGYSLAKGDRRGFVAVDIHGEIFAVARWAGLKTKDVENRLGRPDGLPDVAAVRTSLHQRMTKRLRGFLNEDRTTKQEALKPLMDERRRMVKYHRDERARLGRLQDERLKLENAERAKRFRRGLGAVMDLLSGRVFKTRRENELEAVKGLARDRQQREGLFAAQIKDRAELQKRLDATQARHRHERMRTARHILNVLKSARNSRPERSMRKDRDFGMEI